MNVYRFRWAYASGLTGFVKYEAGAEVELDAAIAAAINADSPGVLDEEPKAEAKPTKRKAKATSNRQKRAATNRAVSSED